MPKTACDYSRTVIYKIQHIDNEALLYIGSTTEFTKRKCAHKNSCTNENLKAYHYKVYQMIRANGGWSEFNMVIVKEFPCENNREAEMEEDKIMREMKTTMNSDRPYSSIEEQKERKKKYASEYFELNSELIIQKNSAYYEENKKAIGIWNKEYCKVNKEKRRIQRSSFYELNADIIRQRAKEKVTCECGCVVTKPKLTNHKKTKKHLKKMND